MDVFKSNIKTSSSKNQHFTYILLVYHKPYIKKQQTLMNIQHRNVDKNYNYYLLFMLILLRIQNYYHRKRNQTLAKKHIFELFFIFNVISQMYRKSFCTRHKIYQWTILLKLKQNWWLHFFYCYWDSLLFWAD